MKAKFFCLLMGLAAATLIGCSASPAAVALPTQTPILATVSPQQPPKTPNPPTPTTIRATNTPSPTSTPVPPTATPTATPLPPTDTATPTATPVPLTRTPVPTVEYSTQTVSFTTEDGYELFGTLFMSEGDTAVVLAHMAGDNDQQNWVPFAKQIAKRGFTGLTFDFRCYGESECGGSEPGDILLSMDVAAAMGFLREQGFQRFVCIGASMGGRSCVNVSFEEELVGLVVVSGTGSYHPDRQNLSDFVSPDMPKLFIVSQSDATVGRTQEMTRLYENSPEPKMLEMFPGQSHGTELFDIKHKRAFTQLLFDFLAGIRS